MVLDWSKKPCLTLSAGKRRARAKDARGKRRLQRAHQLCAGGEVQISHSQPPRRNILHTAQRHVVGAGKARHLGQTGHFAVIQSQLAQHAARLQTRHTHEINGRLGVSAPFKHAAGARPQGEDMTGAA